ncbi:MAG: MarR family transcriptional regulator [Pseudomonadota bacterium]
MSYSEYEYLRAIERLDGAQVAMNDADAKHASQGGHHLQDLVEVLGVQKASASVAIAKLEQRGLVKRFPCQRDARAQHVVLTDKAKDHLRQEETVYTDAATRIKNLLKPNELKALKGTLAKIQDRL